MASANSIGLLSAFGTVTVRVTKRDPPAMEARDDDVRNIFALSSVLERHSLQVIVATTGHDAIQLIEDTPDLSLVLTDSRSGKVLWRTLAYGQGASPDQALKAAMAAVLPGP